MFDINTIEVIKKIYYDYPNRLKDVLTSLSERQQISKEWLVEKLNEYKHPYRNKLKGGDLTITILCCWYGMLAYKLVEKFKQKIFRINTSCEHLHQQTIYDTIDKLERGTLVVLQSNNYHKLQEHINTVKDLQEFVSQYQSRLINIEMYEKDFLEYKRFMILGLKR